MDFLTLSFLVLIVLVSGGIGVLADWLGRKVGKKRLTIFNLRPKTTAQLGTFTTGVIISSVTILLGFVLSSDVREWIQKGRLAIVQLQRTEADLASAREEYRTTKAEGDRLAKDVKSLAQEVESLKRRREEQGKTVAAQRLQIASQKRDADRLLRDLGGLRTKLGAAQSRLSEARGRLADVQGQLAKARAEGKRVAEELKRQTAQVANANQQYNEVARRQYELEMSNLELEKVQGQLQTEVGTLQAQYDKLRIEANVTERQYVEAQARLNTANAELAQAETTLASTRNQLALAQEAIRVSVTASRIQPLIFGIGEELVRQSLAANLSPEDALAAVKALQRSARNLASEKGAQPRGTEFPSAGIFPRQDPQTQRVYSTEELELQLAARIAQKPQEQVLIALSSLNAFRSEPVSLEVAVYDNPVVFRQDDLVAEARIDGAKDEPAILAQVAEFFASEVRDRARAAKMLARGGTGEVVGTVSGAEMLQLAARIQSVGRVVRLQALAKAETRAADPLRLDFRVR